MFGLPGFVVDEVMTSMLMISRLLVSFGLILLAAALLYVASPFYNSER